MAKDIVILDISEVRGGICQIRCCFWIPVTSAYPSPGAVSSYPAITSDPNTSTILASIQAGTIIEEVASIQFPTASITSNWATVESIILAFYNARKNYRAGTQGVLPDPGLKYQILHDSATGWSA